MWLELKKSFRDLKNKNSVAKQKIGNSGDWRNRQGLTEVNVAWRVGVLHRAGHAECLSMALCSCSFHVMGRPVSLRENQGVRVFVSTHAVHSFLNHCP